MPSTRRQPGRTGRRAVTTLPSLTPGGPSPSGATTSTQQDHARAVDIMPSSPRPYRSFNMHSEGSASRMRNTRLVGGADEASAAPPAHRPKQRQAPLKLPALSGIGDVSSRLKKALQPSPLPGDKLVREKKKRRRRKVRSARAMVVSMGTEPLGLEAHGKCHQVEALEPEPALDDQSTKQPNREEIRLIRVMLDRRDAKVVQGEVDFTLHYRQFASSVKESLPLARQESKRTDHDEEERTKVDNFDTSYLVELDMAIDKIDSAELERKTLRDAREWSARPKRINDMLTRGAGSQERLVMKTHPNRKLGHKAGAPPLWIYSSNHECIPLHLQPCLLSVLEATAADLIGVNDHSLVEVSKGTSQPLWPAMCTRPLGMDCSALEELLLLRACNSMHLLHSSASPQERKESVSQALIDLVEETSAITSRATGPSRMSSGQLLTFQSEISIRMVPNLCQYVEIMNAAQPGPLPPKVNHGLVLNLAACQLGSLDIPCVARLLEMTGTQICKVAMAKIKASGGEAPTPQSYTRRLSQNLELPALQGSVITQLLLSGNCLSDGGVTALALCLRELPWVKVLDLSNNKNLTWRCCQALAKVLQTTSGIAMRHQLDGAGLSTIADLSLDGIAIGDKGLELMAGSLCRNQSLKRFSLQSTGISSAGAGCLKLLLEKNECLEELRLGWNRLQGGGVQVVATGLQTNSSLLSLALPSNGLTDVGGSFVAVALHHNKTLRVLDISSNGLGLKTCLVLNESLLHNCTLQNLQLNSNPLGAEGGRHLLARLLSPSCSLHRLGLHNVSFVDHTPGGKSVPTFDPTNPNGNYKLNLDEPADRQVAVFLSRLYHDHGSNSWSRVSLNGAHLTAPRADWPENIPMSGTLCLTFEASVAPEESSSVPDEETFEFVVKEMQHPANDDFWRLSLLKVVSNVCSLTASQAKEALTSFTWSSQALEAAKMLFLTVVDANNIGVLVGCLAEGDQRKLYHYLGAAAFFRSENPAGHYSLSLRRQVDRSVAKRLLAIARREERIWKRAPTICHNFRNVKLNGFPVEVTDPIAFVLPSDGHLVLDFISYASGAVLSARYLPQAGATLPLAIADDSAILRLQASIRSLQEWAGEGPKNGQKGSAAQERKRSLPALLKTESGISESARNLLQGALQRTKMQSRLQRNPLKFAVSKGVSMKNLLSSAEQWRNEYDDEDKTIDPVMDAAHFKRIMQEIDKAADEQIKLATVRKAVVQKVRMATKRIRNLNMTLRGIAHIWDDSVSFVSPLAVVQLFAAKNYCRCSQVLTVISGFDVDNGRQSATRVDMVQALFSRIADPWHFCDILRNMSAIEQLQTLQRNGYLNCIPRNRSTLQHLDGLVFLIRLSVREEYLIFKYLTDRLLEIPNRVSPGNPVAIPVFSELMINGSEALVLEDGRFWQMVCLMAKDRPRPDDSWDPLGTVEFVVAIPRNYMVSQAAVRFQAAWRSLVSRRSAGACDDMD